MIQTDMSKVEPMYYTGLLLLGIVCTFLSANWLGTIILSYINLLLGIGPGSAGKLAFHDIITIALDYCIENNQQFVANVIFICMAVYLFTVTFKGNTTIGFRFASPTYYPMRPNETLLSSFLFNIAILNACNLGITMYCVNTFKYYTFKSYIYKFTQTFIYSNFMYYITTENLVQQIILFLSLICILLNYCKGGYRLRFKDLEKQFGNKKQKK